MKTIDINLDDRSINEAEGILENIGLDIEMSVKILLRRIIKERNIGFLIGTGSADKVGVNLTEVDGSKSVDNLICKANVRYQKKPGNDLKKSKAISILRQEGLNIEGNVTFASKNIASHNYWANPGFRCLDDDWFLILNDWERKELHLFFIPANSLSSINLEGRKDLPEKIDLQIMYNDSTFTDSRSGLSFALYQIKTSRY